ncbi:MAG: hypothetical protein RJA98_3453, partial [Pseudomonadota bacterium]
MAFWPIKFARAGAGRPPAGDVAFLSSVRAAQVAEDMPHANWSLYLMVLAIATAITWAHWAQVDVVTGAEARVIPDGREQVIASLEGGILRSMAVREGMEVEAGQELAQLDPTRVEAQQNEGQAKRLALRGAVVRLMAEVNGHALTFPPEVAAVPDIVAGETESYNARRQALQEGLASNGRSIDYLLRELQVADAMAARGLMSEVEVMRLRRQVNDLRLQSQERINRFRQDASTELVRVQTDLAQLDEQLIVREDVLKRTVITSPIKGMVKNIRMGTVGGVVTAGSPIMEIVPLGPKVLVEARIKPADIGFVRVGQQVEIKLSAYEFNTYGGLRGKVEYISPDALGDVDKSAVDGTYYRARVSADESTLRFKGEPLPVRPGMTGRA